MIIEQQKSSMLRHLSSAALFYKGLWEALFPRFCALLSVMDGGACIEVRLSDGMLEMAEPDANAAAELDWKTWSAPAVRGRSTIIRLSPHDVYGRTVRLPWALAGRLADALEADLLRRTPFVPHQILSDHRVLHVDGGGVVVRQWVVRRSDLEPFHPVLETARRVHVSCAGHQSDDGHQPRLRVTPDRPSGFGLWTVQRLLVAAALVLGLVHLATALAGRAAREDALDREQREIGAQVAAVRDSRKAVGERLDADRDMLAWRNRTVPFTVLWDDLSATIPPDTWLTDVTARLADGPTTIQIAGFSRSSVDVVRRLDASKLFARSRLVGPVILDPSMGVERFSAEAIGADPRPRT